MALLLVGTAMATASSTCEEAPTQSNASSIVAVVLGVISLLLLIPLGYLIKRDVHLTRYNTRNDERRVKKSIESLRKLYFHACFVASARGQTARAPRRR